MRAEQPGHLVRRRTAWTVVLVLSVLGGAGLAAPRQASAGARSAPPTALAIGDSLTFQVATSGHLGYRFAGSGWRSGAVGMIGRRIDEIRPAVEYAVSMARPLRRLFLNIGANDVREYARNRRWRLERSVAGLRATVRAVVDERPDVCVLLVTLATPTSADRRSVTAVRSLNRRIHALARSLPKVHVVDWARASATHPEWRQADGVHLTEQGAAALADLYRWHGATRC